MKYKIDIVWSQTLIRLMLAFVGGVIGGIVVLLVAVHLHGVTGIASTEGAAGLIATIFGGLTALMGVAIMVAFAIQWAFMDHKICQALKPEFKRFDSEIKTVIRKATHGMGIYIGAWLRPNLNDDELDRWVKIALQRWPDIPNAAAYTSGYYCDATKRRHDDLGYPIAQGQIEDLIRKADYWADEALKAKAISSHDPGYPEYVKACTLALHKEPTSAMDYLKKAFIRDDKWRSELLESDQQTDWDILTGMTHGENDIKLLDKLLRMLGLTLQNEDKIKAHCEKRDENGWSQFDVVRKESGDSDTITVEGIPINNNIEWTVRWTASEKDKDGARRFASLSDVIEFISNKYIVTRIKKHEDLNIGIWGTMNNRTVNE